jgi:DNA polymerase-3 subunit delta
MADCYHPLPDKTSCKFKLAGITDSKTHNAYYKLMSLYKRQEIPKLLNEIKQGVTAQVYLVFGERYLCRNAAQELIDHLLPVKERHTTSLLHVDGDQEDFIGTLNLLKTFNLFSGRKIIWVTDTKLFYSKGVAKSVWDKACEKNDQKEPRQALRYLLQMLNLAAQSPQEMVEENIASLSATRWKTLFGFNKPQNDLLWAQSLLANMPPDVSPAKGRKKDAAGMYTLAFEAGIPLDNILVLHAEAVDKRKRLYKYIQENGVILDLAVDPGSSAAAKRDQEKVVKELLHSTLAKYGKEIEPQCISVFLERVGFHPVAAVMEAEKLVLYVGDRKLITRADVDAIIGRTREEALFELTEAVTSGKTENALCILDHLQSSGVHGLAILATLRNHIKKLLLVRSLQEVRSPSYSKSLSFPVFQKNYLPKLMEGREEWSNLLWKNHPYGLFMLFRQAAKFRCENLLEKSKEVLTAEYRMKGSPVDSRIIMDSLLLNLMRHELREEQAS